MLQKLRDQTQGTGFKILVGAIILVLVLFGFGATNLFLGGDPEVARVGDYAITQNTLAVEIQRERRRILAQMGPDFDASSIDPLQLSEYVTQQLVNRQILYQTASGLGVEIPPEVVNESLIASEAYQVDGQFNEAVYRQTLQMMGYNPVDFLSEYTAALSSDKVRDAITDSTAMTDWELAEIVRVVNQRRDFAYLNLAVEAYLDEVEVTEEDVEIRYEEEAAVFMTELTVDASFISLSVDELVDAPSIEVTEDEILSLYEEERSASLSDERRASSHILIQVNEERTDAMAEELITQVAIRLRQGEAFEDLAREVSEDPGSAKQGGKLDIAGKGIFDAEFEQTLWDLTDHGEVSEPIRSQFGYHIIRLDGIEQKDYPDLESQRETLAQKVKRSKAAELFAETARRLEDGAYDEQNALIATAESEGLMLNRAEGISESQPGEGVLGHTSVVNALFSDDVLSGNNSGGIVLGEEQIVFVRVDEQYPPELKPLESVRDDIQASLAREKARLLIDEYKTQAMARLEAGESATEVARSLGAQWIQVDGVMRNLRNPRETEIPPSIREFAFQLPRPSEGERSLGIADMDNGAALVTLTRVTQGDIDATSQAEVAELRRVVEGRAGQLQLQSLLQSAEAELGVERPASVMPEA